MSRIRSRFTSAAGVFNGRPKALIATVSLLAVLAFTLGAWAAWFSYDLTAGLPDRDAIRGLGEVFAETKTLGSFFVFTGDI